MLNNLNIIIYGQNSSTGYSGGRYHSWMMAYAFSSFEHNVTYLTNQQPCFLNDFHNLMKNKHFTLRLFSSINFDTFCLNTNYDWIIVVPDHCSNFQFYINAVILSEKTGAKLCLLNFETPNWVNKVSSCKRNPEDWNHWKFIAEHSSLILSSTNESNNYAKKFYSKSRKGLKYKYCYPSINTPQIDLLQKTSKQKKILWIGRMKNSRHKGTYELPHTLCEEMRGYRLTIISGNGLIEPELESVLMYNAEKFGIKLIFKNNITDKEKFTEICQSILTLFPSQFEGFGIPPIESLYCKTHCIAYDLPVLKETCKDSLTYVKKGDIHDFRKKISEFLLKPKLIHDIPPHIRDIATFSNYSRRLNDIFGR